MNSLLSYGSDDSSDERGTTVEARQSDANYDQVLMDLSDEETKKTQRHQQPEVCMKSRHQQRDIDRHSRRHRSESRERSSGRRCRSREKPSSNSHYSSSRGNHSKREQKRSHSRDVEIRDAAKSRNVRDRSRERRRFSRSRESESKSSKRRSRSRSPRNLHFTKTEQRKPITSTATSTCLITTMSTLSNEAKLESLETTGQQKVEGYLMPGICGRFREQIQKRKQLWQKKDNVEERNNGQTQKVWQTTTFAQDTDGRVASKFKRLMGIKDGGGVHQSGAGDAMRKQEEMFSSMEHQYEIARTATHTMRGVGLGFGSFQR